MVNETQNPIGAEQPSVHFKMPLWQVFAILFAVAILFTLFKLYEQNYLAARLEIQFTPFDSAELESLRRQGRNVLLMVRPADEQELSRLETVLNKTTVRQAMYNLKVAGRSIVLNDAPSEGNQQWLEQNAPSINGGGLAFLGSNSNQVDWSIPMEDVTAKRITEEIEKNR